MFYLTSEIRFIDESKYQIENVDGEKPKRYPIGLLRDEVEIHFLHYKDEKEAETKWHKRVQRMNMDRLFFMFTDRDQCNERLLERFDQMPFERKVCFTARRNPLVKSSVWIEEYANQQCVGNMYGDFHLLKKHFDFIDWLNGAKPQSKD